MSLPFYGSDFVKKITIYGFGPMQNPTRVDTSSFVQKLLAFCIYNKIDFDYDGTSQMGPVTARCPWMKVETNDPQQPIINIEGSQQCIDELSHCFKLNMDSHLTKDEKIQSDNLRYLVENVLYFCYIRTIWVHHSDVWLTQAKLPVPDFLKPLAVGFIRKSIIDTLNIQGNGDLSDSASETMCANIYRELARVLGNKKFLFSDDKPSLIDCCVARFFDKIPESANCTSAQVLKVFEENPQLAKYGARLQDTFFPPPVAKRLLDQGNATYLKAKAKNTQIILIAASVIVGLAAIGGYFGFRYLKTTGWF